MENLINFFTNLAASVGVNLIWGLLILVVGLKLSKWIVKLLSKNKGFDRMEDSVQSFILSLIKVLLYALVISSAAIVWGVPSTSFITIFASAGVTIGLALQGALSNFAGGLMILVFKPFKVGDFIENGSVMGVVKGISIIYTTLTTVDNKVITIPNGSLTNSNVINYSHQPTRRVDFTFSASYNNDVDQVKDVLMKVCCSTDKVLLDPAPFVRLGAHNNSSLDYTVRVWCNSADYWDVFFDMNENVKRAFDKNGISIPYPQLDVHLDK